MGIKTIGKLLSRSLSNNCPSEPCTASHLPDQSSVNSRIWRWLLIIQGYNVDIQHIPGKRNRADSLSRQSVNDTLVRKGSNYDANTAYVKHLRVPEEPIDEQIQEALLKLFKKMRHPMINNQF